MGNCFQCYKHDDYKEHIEKNENPENPENPEKNENPEKIEPPKIELERTQSVDINIILNQIIDKYNEEHPKPSKPLKILKPEKEPEIFFTVKRMNCRINI